MNLIIAIILLLNAVMLWLNRRKMNKWYTEWKHFLVNFHDRLSEVELNTMNIRAKVYGIKDNHEDNILYFRNILKRLDKSSLFELKTVKIFRDILEWQETVETRLNKMDIEKTKQVLTPKVVKTINKIMKHNENKWMPKYKVSRAVVRKNRTTGTQKGKVKYSNLWGYLKDDMK